MPDDGEILTMAVKRNASAPRVLVAEDSPVNQFLLLTILEAAGCSVHIAGDGKTAIEQLLSHEYDVILMDQYMPGMNGPEAVTAIRQLDLNAAPIPIIAITTDGDDTDRFRASVDEFVSKPFDPEQLFEAIAHVTGFEPPASVLAEIVAGLAAIRAPAGGAEPVPPHTDLR